MSPDRLGEIPQQPTFEIPRDIRGRVRWKILLQDQTQFNQIVEAEATRFMSEYGTLSEGNLRNLKIQGVNSFIIYARKNYPGGWPQLLENIGVGANHKPDGYWTPENIRAETTSYYQQRGSLTIKELIREGRSDLVNALRDYPGGMMQLRLDADLPILRKEANFWTEERIKEESLSILAEHGHLSRTLLERIGRNDLTIAISRKYPGGWRQLRPDIGLEHPVNPKGYWTEEQIAKEASDFYQAEGKLSFTQLDRSGRNDLAIAIARKYPGGMRVLKEHLGIQTLEVKPTISPDEANEQLTRLLEVQDERGD